jgi:hypothetical protein
MEHKVQGTANTSHLRFKCSMVFAFASRGASAQPHPCAALRGCAISA